MNPNSLSRMARDSVSRRFYAQKERVLARNGAFLCVLARVCRILSELLLVFLHKTARKWHRTQLSMRNSDSAVFFGPENSFYRQDRSSSVHFMAVFRKSVGLICACFFCLYRQEKKSS